MLGALKNEVPAQVREADEVGLSDRGGLRESSLATPQTSPITVPCQLSWRAPNRGIIRARGTRPAISASASCRRPAISSRGSCAPSRIRERHDRAAEPAAGQPGAVDALYAGGELDQQVDLRDARSRNRRASTRAMPRTSARRCAAVASAERGDGVEHARRSRSRRDARGDRAAPAGALDRQLEIADVAQLVNAEQPRRLARIRAAASGSRRRRARALTPESITDQRGIGRRAGSRSCCSDRVSRNSAAVGVGEAARHLIHDPDRRADELVLRPLCQPAPVRTSSSASPKRRAKPAQHRDLERRARRQPAAERHVRFDARIEPARRCPWPQHACHALT